MKTRSSRYLAILFAITSGLIGAIFLVEWAYQANSLSKGASLGLTALLVLVSSISLVGLIIDLIVAAVTKVWPFLLRRRATNG